MDCSKAEYLLQFRFVCSLYFDEFLFCIVISYPLAFVRSYGIILFRDLFWASPYIYLGKLLYDVLRISEYLSDNLKEISSLAVCEKKKQKKQTKKNNNNNKKTNKPKNNNNPPPPAKKNKNQQPNKKKKKTKKKKKQTRKNKTNKNNFLMYSTFIYCQCTSSSTFDYNLCPGKLLEYLLLQSLRPGIVTSSCSTEKIALYHRVIALTVDAHGRKQS